MEEEMEELYAEGLATHGGPESCAGDPRGRGEALAGVRAGRAIEPRNGEFGAPTLSNGRKATPLARYRELQAGPARSKNQGMYGTSMRENRESPCPPAWLITGRAAQGTPRR
jgi:RNA-directed DNA polymerase